MQRRADAGANEVGARAGLLAALVACCCAACPGPKAALKGKLDAASLPKPITWAQVGAPERAKASALLDRLASLLTRGKTQRRAVELLATAARAARCDELPANASGTPAADAKTARPFFFTFRGRALALYLPGARSARDGVTLHVHSLAAPALALKARPAYGKHGWTLLDTRELGKVDAPFWLTTPLALWGDALTPSGRGVVTLGEAASEPRLVIPDLLIHLAYRIQSTKLTTREQLDPVIAAPGVRAEAADASDSAAVIPAPLDARARAGELATGDWRVVPAGPAERLGLDRSLLVGYGQANRTHAFLAFEGLTASGAPRPSRPQLLVFTSGLGDDDAGRFFIRYAMGRALGAALGALEDEEVTRIWSRSLVVLGAQAGGALGRGVVINARQSEIERDVLRTVLERFAKHHVPYQLPELPGRSAASRLATFEAPVVELALPVAGVGRPGELTTMFDVVAATRALNALVSIE